MKRVLAVLLCLLCALLLLVACGDDSTDTDSSQGSGNNTDNQGHTHTYKTNADWSKDAQGHWYDPTCDCEDAPITKLNHTDANNDGACDVCAYTNHEHEYSEEWTADCTNHWNAADCGHTVAGINVAPHEDKDNDGKCDVCKYIIEDLHEHIYATEWTYGDGYHWHAALCEHKVEVADKAACNVNAAGVCTVCNAKIKDIDKTDILAILQAAVANNFKVISGTVVAGEQAYEGATVEVGKSNQVFFILGNGDSFVKWGSYNKDGDFIGVDEYWFQTISEGEIFGVQMPYYHPNTGERNNQLTLFPVSGDSDKLNGYTYIPGAILAAGYEDNTTLAQTLANLFDIMQKGENVLDAVSNYDAETGKYTFSYDYFFVSETKGNTAQDGSGDEIISYAVEYFEVDVTFTVNSDYVVNFAEFTVKSYRNLEGVDNDISYDPTTNTVTFLAAADPTVYSYQVSQTSGERTYTSIYPKDSLLPVDFELSFVTGTDYNDAGQMYVTSETPIVDIDGDGIGDLELTKETFIRLHIGNVIPASSLPSFMDIEDMEVSCENLDDGNGLLWGTGFFQDPTYSSFMDCISFRTSANSGKYLVTIRFGQVTKKICVTIPGTPTVVIPDDTADTKYVYVSSVNGWEDEYTFTANESGKYTFTLPAGLGFAFKDADLPEYDPFNPEDADNDEHTVEFTLAKGDSVTFLVGAEKKAVFAIGVAFEAADVGGGDDDQGGQVTPPATTDIKGTYTGSNITVVIDETNVTFTDQKGNQAVARYEIVDGAVVLHNDTYGTIWASYLLAVNLTNGAVTSVVYNGNTISVAPAGGDDSGDDEPGDVQGSGTEEDPYIITAGDYTAEYAGNGALGFVYYSFKADKNGIITVTSKFDGTIWLNLGNESNEGEAQSLSAFVPVGSEIVIAVADWDEQPASIPFTVSFEEKASDSFEALVGTWYAKSEDIFTILYTLTINADGKGTFSYDMGYGANEYNVTYVFVSGNSVTVGYSAGSLACTFDGTTFACQTGVMQDAFTFQTTPVEDGGSEGGDDPDEPTYEEDPLKESLLGEYTIGNYNIFIYNSYTSDGYIAEVYTEGYSVDLYFTFGVIDNEDGSYKLTLTYLSRPDYEVGTDKVDEILALDIVITPSIEEENKTPLEELNGTYVDNALNGFHVAFSFDVDAQVYYLNVYGGADDLYYICQATENADGSVTLVLDFDENYWQYWGAEKTDVYELDGKTVLVTKSGDTWTFEEVQEVEGGLEGEGTDESPFVIPEAGDYVSPYQGGYTFPVFMYTATANGYVTISSTYANLLIQYGTVIDTPNNNEGPEGTLSEVKLYVLAGTTVYVKVADNTFPETAVDVPFTVSFEAFESEDQSFLKGEWNGVQAGLGGSVPYTFVFSADGTGSGSYVQWNQTTSFKINYTLVDGNTVIVNFTTEGWFAQEMNMTFTYNSETDELSGDAALIRAKKLAFDSYQINAKDDKYVYFATEDTIVKLTVGGSVMAGTVTVSYSVNGGEEKSLTFNESAEVELKAGDKMLVVITANTYSSLTVSKVYPLGSAQNPIKIESLPFDMTHAGNEGEKYYIYTATEDIILTITCPTGCLVSGTGVSKDANGNYVVTLKKGDSLTFNPWANTADQSESATYTYTITGEAPVVEEPGEGGDVSSVEYVSERHTNGRYIKFSIEGDTMTITRSNMSGGWDASTSTAVYTISGSGADTTTTWVSGTTCTFIFGEDGLPTQITWAGAAYVNFAIAE